MTEAVVLAGGSPSVAFQGTFIVYTSSSLGDFLPFLTAACSKKCAGGTHDQVQLLCSVPSRQHRIGR